jgi:catechol 2,3-dioxygenase-like lactoylglutathione lyase family enzyme
MSTAWTATYDCARPAVMAAFWGLALGYVTPPPPDGFDTWDAWARHHDVPDDEMDDGAYLADPDGIQPSISFLRVPEGKVAKNRLHMDLRVSGGRTVSQERRERLIRAAVEQLTAAGATVLAEHELRGDLDHVVLADPEGNEFCIV